MNKIIFTLTLCFFSSLIYSQSHYVSRKQHITSVNGEYFLNQVNTYFTIDGDKIINTNKKRNKVFEEYLMGETKKGDNIIKWSFNNVSDGTTGKQELVRRSLDTFTNKSSKIVYELTPKE